MNSLSLYGPVPMPALKSVVPSLTIWKWKVPRITGRSAFGALSVIVTSFGPVALTLVDLVGQHLGLRGGRRILVAHERVHDVGRRERLAVVERHVLAQLEHPGLGVLGRERLGQRGLRRQAAVERREAVVEHVAARSSRSGSTAWPDRACRSRAARCAGDADAAALAAASARAPWRPASRGCRRAWPACRRPSASRACRGAWRRAAARRTGAGFLRADEVVE